MWLFILMLTTQLFFYRLFLNRPEIKEGVEQRGQTKTPLSCNNVLLCCVCWPCHAVLCQLSAPRLPSWRLKQRRSRDTGAGWLWFESRKRRPDWTCWVRISQNSQDIQHLSQHVWLFEFERVLILCQHNTSPKCFLYIIKCPSSVGLRRSSIYM